MKIAKKLSLSRALRTNRKGVALVTVLTVMSLTTILVLTFFSLASSEHRASKTYSHGLQAQQVAEQAVNMVIAQIREATALEGRGRANLQAWASQPGAIRTWDLSGDPLSIYKLYSDDQMKVSGVDAVKTEVRNDFASMQGWSKRPDHFVDLNEPVIRGDRVYYPIVNPTASTIPASWEGGYKDEDKSYGDNGVEGFKYLNDVIEEGSFGAKAAKTAEANDGHVPMPVRWIYQLADGTLGVLADSGAASGEYKFETLTGNGKPSAKNPMVARFAFWADDETTKLNVNTHVGGAAWDLPRAGGKMDMEMAKHQPAKNEWQRYPGHMATTHLSPAMAPGFILNLASLQTITYSRDAMEKLFDVVPRVVGGGSESGTRPIDPTDPNENAGLIPDTDPLFPSLDDLVMAPDRTENIYPDATGGEIQGRELSEYLERSKFFITAYSRAPETNMFNRPRVAMWPIYNTEKPLVNNPNSDYERYLTPFDQLIHYCASVGGNSATDRFDYIFRRQWADSPTKDYDDIPRNQQLYDYLHTFMTQPIPGFGGNSGTDTFATKYPDDHQQILTSIFDYIRSLNTYDDSLNGEDPQLAYRRVNDADHLGYTNWRNGEGQVIRKGQGLKGHGQVVPIEIENKDYPDDDERTTRGFGRFYTVSSAQVLVNCAGARGVIKNGRSPAAIAQPNEFEPFNAVDRDAEGDLFLNLPPLPPNITPDDDERKRNSQWPQWLLDVRRDAQPDSTVSDEARAIAQAEYRAAFSPWNWNWQLAFLDPNYIAAVLDDPTTNKFNNGDSRDPRGAPDFGTLSKEMSDNMRLKPGQALCQAMILFNLFTPAVGWNAINPDMKIEIDLDTPTTTEFVFKPDTNPANISSYGFLGLQNGPNFPGKGLRYTWATNWLESTRGARRYGGLLPFAYMLQATPDVAYYAGKQVPRPNNNPNFNQLRNASRVYGGGGRLTPLDRYYHEIEDSINDTEVEDVRKMPNDKKAVHGYRYDLVTLPFPVDINKQDQAIDFTGGQLRFRIYHGDDHAEGSAPDNDDIEMSDNKVMLQEIVLDFPAFTEHAPRIVPHLYGSDIDARSNKYTGGDPDIPTGSTLDLPYIGHELEDAYAWGGGTRRLFSANMGWINKDRKIRKETFNFLERVSLTSDPGNLLVTSRLHKLTGYSDAQSPGFNDLGPGDEYYYPDKELGWPKEPQYSSVGSWSGYGLAHGRLGQMSITRAQGWNSTMFGPGDVIRSVEVTHGDLRMVAASKMKGGDHFDGHHLYEDGDDFPGTGPAETVGDPRMAHSMTNSVGNDYWGFRHEPDLLIIPELPKVGNRVPYAWKTPIPFGRDKSVDVQRYGDFDNGTGLMTDGPYINKPDEGNISQLRSKDVGGDLAKYWESIGRQQHFPYFTSHGQNESGGPAYFSPNRLVSGPGMLGSLPTGIMEGEPWRTLLFRPDVRGNGYATHPGAEDPPDHLMLDLFWMPVVEPYAISEPFSTAGKVNMNYQMAPFLHITRNTALRGVFRSEYMACIPDDWHTDYKVRWGVGQRQVLEKRMLRSAIVDSPTLDQFEDYFNNGEDIFKSATEICDIHLIPQQLSDLLDLPRTVQAGSFTPTVDQMRDGTYWRSHALVGDNAREKPYTNIHQRLTTKSNTFKVHYRAQVIKQARRESDDEYGVWRSDFDTVQAEYRGSSIVERFVDPNNSELPDFATQLNRSLDEFYQYRVVNPRRFAP